MDRCARCDHPLGVGRFCTGCGHPRAEQTVASPAPADDDWRTGTAERPAVPGGGASAAPTMGPQPAGPQPAGPRPPVTPPPAAYGNPPPVRYPLFADEAAAAPTVHGPAPHGAAAGHAELAPAAPPSAPSAAPGELGAATRRPRRSPLPWVAAVLALVLVASLGGLLLLGDREDDADPAAGGTTPTSTQEGDATPEGGAGTTEGGETPQEPGEPEDVSRRARALVPATADPGTDVNGDVVRYEARNMLDGRADTCWRMPGDGTGAEVVLRLDGPTVLSAVGLVNGYAKREPGYDGYAANRRVLEVEWVFDDGSVLPQSLEEDTRLQTLSVPDVATETVTLRLLRVSAPGRGQSGRDYTAISEIALTGTPA